MIKKLNELDKYNPIRPHIDINFIKRRDYDDKLMFIVEDLIKNNFDPLNSRVLVFASSRKKTEEAVLDLSFLIEEKKLNYCNKIDFYHAGLEGSEREEKFENYKTGKIAILFATKAFGMGMDIPNVHYIYHIDPSSNFEDFLQEVGRAGRNREALDIAGFSENKPIKTNFLIGNGDFGSVKDRLHSNQITWKNIIEIQISLYRYVRRFKLKEGKAFPLPLDLINEIDESNDPKDNTYFRVILYWLERAGKIQLGTYTPTHIPVKILLNPNFSIVNSEKDRSTIKSFLSKLSGDKSIQKNKEQNLMIHFSDLQKFTNSTKIYEIWRILFLAQKAGAISIERIIKLESTKTRINELVAWNDYNLSPTIEAVFDFAKSIMSNSKYNEQTHFQADDLNHLALEAIENNINPDLIFWKEKEKLKEKQKEKSKEYIAKNLSDDFKKKRKKVAFHIINYCSKWKNKSIIQVDENTKKPETIQLIFNGQKRKEAWIDELSLFKEKLIELIKYIHKRFYKKNQRKFNIAEIIVELSIEEKGENYLNQLLFIAKGLGFLKGSEGGIIPMGIELFINDQTILSENNLSAEDQKVRKEFEESIILKELRLMTLQCIAEHVHKNNFDRFIKNYFKCKNIGDLLSFLETEFDDNNGVLSAFRAEALTAEKAKLNPHQKAVYDAPIDSNIRVDAGPGSGKTHTLTLRVARLIHEEKINPEEILILAYNRAVVVELKDRLSNLFSKLGYSKLTRKLKVFTFDGFCKYALGDELVSKEFSEWYETFLEIAHNSPGIISQKLGNIRHVFVDEFQDINGKRLDLLEYISNPKSSNICVIGDPNQSIYGYQRVDEQGSMDPKPYYNRFNKIYNPKTLNLSINYRSYQEIIDCAEELLNLNNSKAEMPPLKAFNTPEDFEQITEFYNYLDEKIDWKIKLVELANYETNDGKNYKDIALMFRSNAEVFKAFSEIKRLPIEGFQIRIQGSSNDLSTSREFYFFLQEIKLQKNKKVSTDYFNWLMERQKEISNHQPNWDEHKMNIFLCIAYDFKKELDEYSTYEDLYSFIIDISLKDDGQIGKVYHQNISIISGKKSKREIILTTMHKVKGIEYDAVLIPPSFSSIPLNHENFDGDINDVFEEERRLYYVAYTRAKYKLVVIKWKRENALYGEPRIEPVLTNDGVKNRFGLQFNEDLEKFNISWGASSFAGNSFNTLKNIVKIGSPIQLKVEQQGIHTFAYVHFENNRIAQLSINSRDRLAGFNRTGLVISSVNVWTYEQTLNSEDGEEFAKKWTQSAKERGYIYIPEFSGYAKEIS